VPRWKRQEEICVFTIILVLSFVQEQTVKWDLLSMLRSMSWLAQAVVLVLLVMMARSAVVVIERSRRYRVARLQSQAFVRESARAFREGNLGEAVSVAERNSKSHIANVVAGGLAAFQLLLPIAADANVIDAARRGLKRSIPLVHGELKNGLSGLATIGSTAPFVGLFGTVLGIMHAFHGPSGEKSTLLSGLAGAISEALLTTALGLLVAVLAVWCFNYFTTKMEAFDIEMENSSMELVSYLTVRLRESGKHQQ
jgi:biopolymer transport protein ExbB/TolQ